MPKYLTTLETEEGRVQIVTRSTWLYIFPMPYTSVVPHRAADLARFGTFIRWQSSASLKACHDAVICLLQERGLSGVAEVAASEKRTARLAKSMGMTYRELVEEAVRSREAVPGLDGVLKHVKKFM